MVLICKSVCVVSILRLVVVHQFVHRRQVTSTQVRANISHVPANSTESGTYALILSAIEVNVALSCASLLVLKPLLVRYLPVIVSEKPVTAREDIRRFSAHTDLFSAALDDMAEDVEKATRGKRRDTVVSGQDTCVRGAELPTEMDCAGGTVKKSRSI